MKRLFELVRQFIDPRIKTARLRRAFEDHTLEGHDLDQVPLRARSRVRPADVLLNFPLLLGAIIVLVLFAIVLFGPLWAPENPYVSGQHLVPHYNPQTGEYIQPPLYPSEKYLLGTDRWGNDLFSLLLHGARNTLVACAFITMVRILLGCFLGGIAGWNENTLVDRLVMGTIGVITSVPMLISSILLIYALDIHEGLPVFIAALSLIGWSETAQYIRSEFLVLKKMPYIEGARALGLDSLAIAVRHALPNVLPQLLVITFLEMGAVMMLLGELGFVGVFIGGGTRISIETDPFVYEFRTLIQVPEWGAMLADGYRWMRSRPFVILPPAVSFFGSVIGFNALGEGLRRLVEKNSLSTAFLLRKRMLLVVAVVVLATVFIINNTGPAPWFAQVAGSFSGEQAYAHVQALSEMEGRGIAQPGAEQAAAYIETQFEAYGLLPAWAKSSYRYPLAMQIARPAETPALTLLDEQGQVIQSFRHQTDFGFVTDGHGGSGEISAPLTWVGFTRSADRYDWQSFRDLDLRGRVVLLLEGQAPSDFAQEALIRGAVGILWITREDQPVHSQIGLSPWALIDPQIPIFRVRDSAARQILDAGEFEPLDLALVPGEDPSSQFGPGWVAQDLAISAHLSLHLNEPQAVEVPCVLGYKPGTDYDLAGELIVIYAPYDGLGVEPDGTLFPAANRHASAVGTLLEVARIWHEQDLDPRRSVLFVAWGAGHLDHAGAAEFLSHDANFRRLPAIALNKPELLIQLGALGAGGENLNVYVRSSARLPELFQDTANEVGLSIVTGDDAAYVGADLIKSRLPRVYVARPDDALLPLEDTMERIDQDKLQSAGELIGLALTKIVRQSRY